MTTNELGAKVCQVCRHPIRSEHRKLGMEDRIGWRSLQDDTTYCNNTRTMHWPKMEHDDSRNESACISKAFMLSPDNPNEPKV